MATDAAAARIDLDDLAARAATAFRAVHERLFADDPATNPRLSVEVVEAADVAGAATFLLVTPWAVTGIVVPADGAAGGPSALAVAGKVRSAHRGDLPPLGVYWSVTLVPDVSRLTGSRQARALAESFAEPFRDGVRSWLGGSLP